MASSMEWFIGGVLTLIVGIIIYIMHNNAHVLVFPVLCFLFGIYKLATGKN